MVAQCEGGRQCTVLQTNFGAQRSAPSIAQLLPNPPHENRPVCTQPATMEVQLVEHQETQISRRLLEERAFAGTDEQMLEHYVVREEGVRMK